MRTLLRITKLALVPGTKVLPAMWESLNQGAGIACEHLLPVDYTIDGYLLTQIHLGSRLDMIRLSRNGTYAFGSFTTTEILEIAVKTKDSIYLVQHSPDADAWNQILNPKPPASHPQI